MLLDSNILLYAHDSESPHFDRAKTWLESALAGDQRIGVPWVSVAAFIRIATNPRIQDRPQPPAEAWARMDALLDADLTWVPEPGPAYRSILRRVVVDLDLRGNLVADAVLAALAIEHGLAVVSADSDFARFREIRWINPLA